MPLDLALDLAHALDPVGFVQDRLKFAPDPWQARLLRSRAPWILLSGYARFPRVWHAIFNLLVPIKPGSEESAKGANRLRGPPQNVGPCWPSCSERRRNPKEGQAFVIRSLA